MSLGFNNSGDTVIATCVRQVIFLKINGSTLESKSGSGWGKTPADTVMCQVLANSTLFTGTFLGEIIAWVDSTIATRISAHSGKINCIHASRDGSVIVTGGADGNVMTWSVKGTALEPLKTFNLKKINLQSLKAYPTSVCLSNDGENILIGTRGGEICEIN
jgi:WD40 repeat protein